MKIRFNGQILRRHIRAKINDVHIIKTGNSEFDYFITSSSTSRLQRIFWLSLIILCACICCYQVTNRVQWYFTYPVSVLINVYRVQVNEKLEIQFCSNDIFKRYGYARKDINKLYLTFDAKRYSSTIQDIILTYPNGREISIKNYTKILNEITLFGRCSMVNLSGQPALKTSIIVQWSAVTFYPKTESQSQQDVSWRQHLLLKVRKYELVNAPTRPCVSDTEFKKCFDDCVVLLLNKTMKCRHYTYPINVTLPPCERVLNPMARMLEYMVHVGQMKNIVYMTDMNKHCGCTKRCSRTNSEVIITPTHLTQTIIETNDIAVSMTEKLIYDKIDLIIDVAGSVGLLIGLTLLSIVDIIFTSVKSVKKKCGFQKIKIKRLYSMINSIYLKYKDDQKDISSSQISKLMKAFKVIIYSLCVCMSILMIQDRVCSYLLLPIQTIVDVDVLSSVALPSMTVCTPNRKLEQDLTKIYLRFNWSFVDMFGLLDRKNNYTIGKIWNSTFLPKTYPVMYHMARWARHVNVTEITTHVGNCRHLRFEKEIATRNASYTLMYTLYPVNENCTSDAYLIYETDPTSNSYNIINQIVAPYNAAIKTIYQFQKITRLNRISNPCTNQEQLNACTQDCLTQQLQQANNLCHLPFFPFVRNMKTCKSSFEAKRSRDRAIEIILATANGKCNCSRRCEEIIFFSAVELNVLQLVCNIHVDQVVISQTLEHVIEINKYSLVALFCDIGNILGIFLGLSVLTILTYIHRVVNHERK